MLAHTGGQIEAKGVAVARVDHAQRSRHAEGVDGISAIAGAEGRCALGDDGGDRLGDDGLGDDGLGDDRLGDDRLGDDRLGGDRLGDRLGDLGLRSLTMRRRGWSASSSARRTAA